MQISAVNAQTRYMVKKLLTAAAVVCILAGAAGGCVKFVSDTGGYYIPEDLAGFSSLTCETDGKTVKVQKKDGYYIIDAGDEAYILAKECGAKFTGGTQEELDKRQASAALYSVMNETGLIYGALDKKSYIMTDTSGKYRADGKEFFYSAEYMRKKLTGEPLENFESYFEKISPEKFGDFEDYVITLDCSKQNQMLLQIENTRFATVSKYTFRNVDATDVPLTAQMRAYLESLTLSA